MDVPALIAVARLTDSLSRASTLPEVYSAALDALQQGLGMERASILLFDEHAFMGFVAWRGISEQYRAAVNGHTPWSPEMRNPDPMLVPDVETDSTLAAYRDVFRREGIRGLGFFPLNYRDRVIGKLMVYSAEPHDFTEPSTVLAKTIAGQIAFGIARIRAEEEIARQRERLAETVRHVPGMVWETILDPSGQVATFVSDGIRELVGYTPEEWYANPNLWLEMLVDFDAQKFREAIERAARERTPLKHVVRLRTKQGGLVWAEVRTTHRLEQGRLVSRGVTFDITAQKLSERRSRFLEQASTILGSSLDYEETLNAVARLATAGFADWCVVDLKAENEQPLRLAVAHADPDKQMIADRWKRDYPPDRYPVGLAQEVVGNRMPMLVRKADETLLARLRSTETGTFVEQLGVGSGIIAPVIAGGRNFGVITFVRSGTGDPYDENDVAVAAELARRAGYAIDNARLFRQAQEASRAKDEFLATLSHELRTPMTATLGWATMLRMKELSPENFETAIETIERSTRAQARLIDEIYDVSRIVTGKLRLTIAPVNLHDVIDAAVDAIRPTLMAKGLHLDTHLSAIAGSLPGDAARLQQVIWNLLSNAVKFTPPGGSIAVIVEQPEAAAVSIMVRDSGAGIPKQFLPYLFERFRQADSSASRAVGGLGLGLAIVKNIVELHGGSVSAFSQGEGKGAAFAIRLPLLAQTVAVAHRDAAAAPLSLEGLSVLVLEDDADTRLLLSNVLQSFGASVTAVENASAAKDMLRLRRPHVIVSDIAMPGEDGFTFLHAVRGSDLDGIPAIAVTAYARPEDRERILASGFADHLAKPVDPLTVVKAVREAAARRNP